MLFCAMEEEVREHLQEWDMKEGFREQVVTAVKKNDEVLFPWCMLTADIDKEHAQTVLDMLTDLWMTIRGFAFASSFLEMYKREKKKGLKGPT